MGGYWKAEWLVCLLGARLYKWDSGWVAIDGVLAASMGFSWLGGRVGGCSTGCNVGGTWVHVLMAVCWACWVGDVLWFNGVVFDRRAGLVDGLGRLGSRRMLERTHSMTLRARILSQGHMQQAQGAQHASVAYQGLDVAPSPPNKVKNSPKERG